MINKDLKAPTVTDKRTHRRRRRRHPGSRHKSQGITKISAAMALTHSITKISCSISIYSIVTHPEGSTHSAAMFLSLWRLMLMLCLLSPLPVVFGILGFEDEAGSCLISRAIASDLLSAEVNGCDDYRAPCSAGSQCEPCLWVFNDNTYTTCRDGRGPSPTYQHLRHRSCRPRSFWS
jgi:hypothetical protein